MLEELSSQPEQFLASSSNHGAVLKYFEDNSGLEREVPILEELLQAGAKVSGFRELKASLLESLISRVFFAEVPPRLSEILLSELDDLSSEHLSSFSSLFLDALSDRDRDLREDVVNIVGKLLFLLAENKGQTKQRFISSLCAEHWRPSNAIILCSIFRASPLSPEQLGLIIDKVSSLLPSLSPEQVPPLVHQALHLTQASGDSNAPLLRALQRFYTLKECSSSFYHSRDTSMLHILQAIKIGHSISSHLLKLLRSLDYRCLHDPFLLFTVLSISSVKHIRKQVLEGLRTLCVKHVEFTTRALKTAWLAELGERYPGPFQDTILSLISSSIRFGGWSFIQNGCIELTFSLLDVCGGAKNNNSDGRSQAVVGGLATAILVKILHDAPDSAEVVIKEMSSRVMASMNLSQYIRSLRKCIRKNLNVFLQNTSLLTSLLDQVPHMAVHPARRIISAFQPLFKRSRLLRDQLIMIFRKALFSSNIDSRQIAILGVLELIKCFKLNASSQTSISTLSQSSGSFMSQSVVDIQSGVQLSNESICLELLSVLKRGFGQQAAIRKTIYKELCVVLSLNPEICNSCLDILYQQSVVNKIKSKVDIGTLIQNDRVYEPVGWFLHCTQYTIARGQELYQNSQEDYVASLDKLSKMLQALCEHYSKIDETDLQIESGQSALAAEILQNIYESLIEFCVMNNGEEPSDYKISKVYSLYQKYKSIEVPAEEPLAKVKKTGKEGSKESRSSSHNLALSSKAIIILLRISLSSSSDELNDDPFILWVLKLAKAKILELENSIKTSGSEEGDLINSELCVFGSSLIEHCVQSSSLKSEHVAYISDCLHSVFLLNEKYYPESLKEFITKLENAELPDYFNCIRILCKKFIDKTNEYLEKLEDDDEVPRILVNFLKIIWLLAECCPGENVPELKFINDWIKHIVKGSSSCPLFLQKILIEVLLSLELKMKNSPRVLVDLAREVHLKVGDTKGDQVAEPGKFNAIDKDSAEEVCLILVSHLGHAMDTADLLLGNLTQITTWNTHEKKDSEAAMNLEASLCHFLAHLSNACIELSQTAFPNCSTVQDSIFKLFTRLYFALGKMSKYFGSGFTGKKNSSIQTSRFDKLVEIISDQLTKKIYTLINFAEDLSQSNVASNRSKSRATKDSKIIPQLIFSIAEFEKNLMKLNPRSHIDLIQFCRVSTARDFRFNIEALDKSDN